MIEEIFLSVIGRHKRTSSDSLDINPIAATLIGCIEETKDRQVLVLQAGGTP